MIFDKLNEIENLPSYGLETFMNNIIINNNLKIKVVYWDNVLSPWKSWKVGKIKGFIEEIKMTIQILKISSPLKVIRQIIKMHSLKIKD